jgi:protocatechuate 3,4-dioxygenase beta subunit
MLRVLLLGLPLLQLPHLEIRPPAPQQAAQPAARAKSEKPCSVSGQVLNAATGEPLRKAEISLHQADPSPSAGGMPTSYGTTTDAGGKFAMKDIEPGKYRLMVMRSGFVYSEYGSRGPRQRGTTLALDPAQEVKDIVIRLTPHGVIAGRVVDEDNEPVPNVMVQAMRFSYGGGKKQLMPLGRATTNDLGEYRAFGLPPGRYYVNAVFRNMGYPAALDRSAAPQPEEGYVPTWYPGTTVRAGAATVDVQAGGQARGVDFTLAKMRTVRVRGRVVNETGLPGRGMMISLFPRDVGGVGAMGGNNGPVDPQGNFNIRSVAPGAYYVFAGIFDAGSNFSARQAVDVGNTDVENVTLTITRGMEVAGQVKVEGPAAPPLSGVQMYLRPREQGMMMFGGPPPARVEENGAFTMKGVSPDHYDFRTYGLPDGYYVKSVRMGDEEALEAGLNLTRGAAPVTVVLSPGAGAVSGLVQNDKQQPASGVTVVLVPAGERRQRAESYKNTATDQYGRYTLKNLDPGDYKLFAWEDVEPGAWSDPDFLKPLESRGHSVTIRENSRENAQLDLIPAETEQAAAKPAQ